jgi:hypothetical protein
MWDIVVSSGNADHVWDSAMDDEQVDRAIAELERGLRSDDPGLARRFRRISRGDSARLVAVVVALTAAAILLAAGLALASGAMWLAGLAAFLAAFGADRRRELSAVGSHTVEGRRVDQWNEVVPIAGAWSTVVGELRAADGLDPWCPTLRRVSNDGARDTVVVSVGHHRPVSLRVTRRWFADGIRWRADADGSVLVGHVTLQPAATGDHVVAWVHAEAPRCRHSRRALRAVRRETRTALRRWAATRCTET